VNKRLATANGVHSDSKRRFFISRFDNFEAIGFAERSILYDIHVLKMRVRCSYFLPSRKLEVMF
jgi:hypothetical protein